MTGGLDILLPAGAAAFYLYDSALPMYGNEALLTCRRGRWAVLPPSQFVMLGRRIALLPPWLPNLATFRVTVSAQHFASTGQAEVDDPGSFLQATRGLGTIALMLLFLLLLALPVTSLLIGSDILVLAVFAAYYLVLLGGLGVVFRRRKALGVEGRAFAGLAFDVLLCAPFGVNLLRKLTLRRGLRGNAAAFAKRNFEPATWDRFRAVLPDAESR